MSADPTTVRSNSLKFTVGPGVEGIFGHTDAYDFDVSDSQILITLDPSLSFGSAGWLFSESAQTLPPFASATVSPESNLRSFDNEDVFVEEDFIFLRLNFLHANSNTDERTKVLVNVALVPEPSGFAIIVCGTACLYLLRPRPVE